ncbi:MAG: 16S rRNA (cytidine(1402)-2'-O)-methyltransferase [Deltaproteobacteria bacterium]|nr:16S rRNA (cytidine(1402)-2'-O)-methyltransferase [Deltaproteobacteria bacterium]
MKTVTDKKGAHKQPGILYIVATPIGNLEDITFRAVRVLKAVKLIAAEDTRQTRKLLNAYGIATPQTSLFDRNEKVKSGYLIKKIEEGFDIAYVSDAGTPGVSDPGFVLINEAITHGVQVVPIPGVSAVITALCASGLPMTSFVFNGFLPQKPDKRKGVLLSIKDDPRTSVFYESPKRLCAALQDISDVLGNRNIVVARELTKVFEEIVRGSVDDVMGILSNRVIKGEITLIVGGQAKTPAQYSRQELRKRIEKLKKTEDLSVKDMADRLSDEFAISRRTVYQQILKSNE